MCGAAGMALGIVASQLLAKKTDAGNDGKAIECMPPVPSGKRRYLLFGKNGWIGGMLIDLLTQAGEEVCIQSFVFRHFYSDVAHTPTTSLNQYRPPFAILYTVLPR